MLSCLQPVKHTLYQHPALWICLLTLLLRDQDLTHLFICHGAANILRRVCTGYFHKFLTRKKCPSMYAIKALWQPEPVAHHHIASLHLFCKQKPAQLQTIVMQ